MPGLALRPPIDRQAEREWLAGNVAAATVLYAQILLHGPGEERARAALGEIARLLGETAEADPDFAQAHGGLRSWIDTILSSGPPASLRSGEGDG